MYKQILLTLLFLSITLLIIKPDSADFQHERVIQRPACVQCLSNYFHQSCTCQSRTAVIQLTKYRFYVQSIIKVQIFIYKLCLQKP